MPHQLPTRRAHSRLRDRLRTYRKPAALFWLARKLLQHDVEGFSERQAGALGLMGAVEVGVAAIPAALLYDNTSEEVTWIVVGLTTIVMVGIAWTRLRGPPQPTQAASTPKPSPKSKHVLGPPISAAAIAAARKETDSPQEVVNILPREDLMTRIFQPSTSTSRSTMQAPSLSETPKPATVKS